MDFYPVAIEKLIEEFAKLPSIGQKTAQRLTLHILNLPEDEVKEFASALVKARGTIKYCSVCETLQIKTLVRYVEIQIEIKM